MSGINFNFNKDLRPFSVPRNNPAREESPIPPQRRPSTSNTSNRPRAAPAAQEPSPDIIIVPYIKEGTLGKRSGDNAPMQAIAPMPKRVAGNEVHEKDMNPSEAKKAAKEEETKTHMKMQQYEKRKQEKNREKAEKEIRRTEKFNNDREAAFEKEKAVIEKAEEESMAAAQLKKEAAQLRKEAAQTEKEAAQMEKETAQKEKKAIHVRKEAADLAIILATEQLQKLKKEQEERKKLEDAQQNAVLYAPVPPTVAPTVAPQAPLLVTDRAIALEPSVPSTSQAPSNTRRGAPGSKKAQNPVPHRGRLPASGPKPRNGRGRFIKK